MHKICGNLCTYWNDSDFLVLVWSVPHRNSSHTVCEPQSVSTVFRSFLCSTWTWQILNCSGLKLPTYVSAVLINLFPVPAAVQCGSASESKCTAPRGDFYDPFIFMLSQASRKSMCCWTVANRKSVKSGRSFLGTATSGDMKKAASPSGRATQCPKPLRGPLQYSHYTTEYMKPV